MAKGFGIAALVLAIVAIFIPFGIFISAIAILCAIIAALAGDRIFASATPIIALVNTFILSPSTWIWMSESNAFTIVVLLAIAAPFIAMFLNASGKVVLSDSKPASSQ